MCWLHCEVGTKTMSCYCSINFLYNCSEGKIKILARDETRSSKDVTQN